MSLEGKVKKMETIPYIRSSLIPQNRGEKGIGALGERNDLDRGGGQGSPQPLSEKGISNRLGEKSIRNPHLARNTIQRERATDKQLPLKEKREI